MLFEMMAANSAFWTLGGEGHAQVESIPSLAPRNRGFDSNRLTAQDASPAVCAQLHANYVSRLRNASGRSYIALADRAPATIRFLEKTPKNALRIPFLAAVYPDAKFVFLHRDAKTNMSSIMDAWRSRRFVTYRDLPGWTGQPWSLLLLPDWRGMVGAGLAEVALHQWCDTNNYILDDLAALPREDWCTIRYEDLTADPDGTLRQLCDFSGVECGNDMRKFLDQPAGPSRYAITPPHPDKWRKNEAAIVPLLPRTRATADRLAALHANRS